jgi:tRNA wybutosine-synthesizing protein 1
MLTALLGLVMFGEKLPPLWWVGAAGLVVGNVVVGRREEGDGSGKGTGDMRGSRPREGYRDVDVDGDGDGDGVEMDGKVVGGEVDVVLDESRAPAKG